MDETIAAWRAAAELRLERIIAHGDDYGDIANTTGDDLRDMLMVAAEWLRDDREVLTFADGVVASVNMRFGERGFVLADLYSEDCEWAQNALRRAGCHPRGRFLDDG